MRLVVGLAAAASWPARHSCWRRPGPSAWSRSAAAWLGDVARGRSGRIARSRSAARSSSTFKARCIRPGIQRLPAGSRVGDAIAAAGGYGPRVERPAPPGAEPRRPVQDGDRIVVPARGDPSPAAGGAGDGGGAGGAGWAGLVNLNTATATELDALPGVGPVTAQKILDARAEQPFATVDELRERKVVGAATFDKLRDLVTVR